MIAGRARRRGFELDAARVAAAFALLSLAAATVRHRRRPAADAASTPSGRCTRVAETAPPFLDDQVLFPEEPHAWYRIPSIVVAKSGVVLAFAERRLGTNHDWGHDSESVLRRSFDNGKTWQPMQTIISIKHLDPDSGPVVVDTRPGGSSASSSGCPPRCGRRRRTPRRSSR